MSNEVSLRLTSRGASAAATLLMLGASALSGCASQPQVASVWAEGAPKGQAYSRVLVVGVAPKLAQRCPFERYLAQQIQSEHTTAIVSCDALDPPDPLTREWVEAAVAAHQADAVIATTLVSQSWGTQQGGSMDTRGGGAYKAVGSGYATGYYGAYGVPVVYAEFQTAPSVTEMKGEVHVESKVFDTRSAALVYTVDTTVGDIQSKAGGLFQVTTPIAERLRRDGLIR